MRTKLTHALAVTAAALLALPALAFAGGSEMKEKGAGGSGAAGALTDAEIAAVVVAANDVDIEMGQVAEDRATNLEVNRFAEKMMMDHRSLNKQTTDLAKRLKLEPKENALSKQLKSDGRATKDKLKKLEGDAFNRAYVDHEVQYHTAVIETVKTKLLPNAKNPELKALLEKASPVLQDHLDHAKQLQQSLQGVGGSGEGELKHEEKK